VDTPRNSGSKRHYQGGLLFFWQGEKVNKGGCGPLPCVNAGEETNFEENGSLRELVFKAGELK